MKPVGEFLVVAERVIHDSQTELVSLVQCLEVVASAGLPGQHAPFGLFARYRLDGPPPVEDVAVSFRVVRSSPGTDDRVIVEFPGVWRAGTTHARLHANFEVLQLDRAERITFRAEHRVDEGPWEAGPVTTLDVIDLGAPPRADGP